MRELNARGGVRMDVIREFTGQKAERLTFGRRHEGIQRPLRRPDRRQHNRVADGKSTGSAAAGAQSPLCGNGDLYSFETPLETDQLKAVR